MTDLLSNASAVISDCGLYRYRLDRDYAPSGRSFGPRMAWIMVNPSTADGETDDATIRKVVGFSRRHNCFRVAVGNLFAFRATDVRELKTAADPIGPDNDRHLQQIINDAQCVVVAWGPLAKQPKHLRGRFRRIAELAGGKPLWCFGTANDGQPRHPLMLAYDTPLVPWEHHVVRNMHQIPDKLTAIGDRSPSGPGRETGPVHESPGSQSEIAQRQSPNLQPPCISRGGGE